MRFANSQYQKLSGMRLFEAVFDIGYNPPTYIFKNEFVSAEDCFLFSIDQKR